MSPWQRGILNVAKAWAGGFLFLTLICTPLGINLKGPYPVCRKITMNNTRIISIFINDIINLVKQVEEINLQLKNQLQKT